MNNIAGLFLQRQNLVGIKSKSNMAWLEIENGHIEGRHNATGKKGRVFVYTRKRG